MSDDRPVSALSASLRGDGREAVSALQGQSVPSAFDPADDFIAPVRGPYSSSAPIDTAPRQARPESYRRQAIDEEDPESVRSSPSGLPPRSSIAHSNGRTHSRETGGGFFSTSPGYGNSYGASPMGYLVRSFPHPVHQAKRRSTEIEHPPSTGHSHSASPTVGLHPGASLASTQVTPQSSSPATHGVQPLPHATSLTAPLLDGELDGLDIAEVADGFVPHSSVKEATTGPQDEGPLKAFVFGMINAAVGLPALIAFAAIVFQAPLFGPYVGSLCKFFFFSSGIHQLVFVARSTLPFAIGQVQDVGLIFMSAMATDIAGITHSAGLNADVALGTTLVTLTLSTLVVGLLTFVVGKFKLAGLVQYVPLPVVGGYLGYVGYFCIASGIALGAGVEVGTLSSWVNLLSVQPAIKLVPTLGACLIFMQTMEHVSHPLALPAVLLAVPLAFHAVLLTKGWSLHDAQEGGWVMEPTEGEQYFWQLWSLYNIKSWKLDGICLSAMFRQVPKLAGLFLVVCFGSCMDVAAIQQDMPEPLDFNKELCTVGVSNIATACLGAGYTGSYIFSQTIFTMRAGVHNRLCGLTVAAVELAVFALPFSVVQYMPNFFFGALLVWFGIEISRDWLILSMRKLSRAEYVLLWLTFTCIMEWGLEGGIACGIVMATLYFAWQYAQSQISSLRLLPLPGVTQHGYDTQVVLDAMLQRRVVALGFSGFIFFGSAMAISERVEKLVDMMMSATYEDESLDCILESDLTAGQLSFLGTPALPSVVRTSAGSFAVGRPHGNGGGDGGGTGNGAASGGALGGSGVVLAAAGLDRTKAKALAAVLVSAPAFIILDFGAVSGLDATGARTFGGLVNQLSARGVTPIFTNVWAREGRALLAAHGVALQRMGKSGSQAPPGLSIPEDSSTVSISVGAPPLQPGSFWEYPSCQAAMRYVQSVFLGLAVDQGLVPAPSAVVSLEDMLEQQLKEVALHGALDVHGVAAALGGTMTRCILNRGDTLFSAGEPANELYLIEYGQLRLSHGSEEALPGLAAGGRAGSGQDSQRHSDAGPGCLVAAVDFYLQRPASFTAICATHSARLLRLSRSGFQRLLTNAPGALNLLQVILMRATCLELSGALETLAQLDGDSARHG